MSEKAATTTRRPTRPYRSHRIPACEFCRRRKSRCTQDLPDKACLLCRLHGVECSKIGPQKRSVPPSGRRSPRGRPSEIQRPRDASSPNVVQGTPPLSMAGSRLSEMHQPTETTRNSGVNHPEAAISSAQSSRQSGHIIGPAVARDAQVLEQYMSPTHNLAVSHVRPNPYSVYSDDPRNPVVYMKVPRQRGVSPPRNGSSGFKQFETLEKIVEPLGPDLFDLYFDTVHPSFPILDEKTVVEAYRQNGLPHALVCEIYAVTLVSWNASDKLRATGRPRPDVRYIWNLSVSALHEDFLAPSFSTVLASILDLWGRPITSITYNAVNLGRTIALSHSLGLNRNPATWSLDHRQKSLRVRTWWGILIHDRWASLAHGTPPLINRKQYDVPLPDLDSLLVSQQTNGGIPVSSHRLRGGHCFIALCRLTEILGQVLPLIYDLDVAKQDSYLRPLRRLEADLDEWEDFLPPWLNPSSAEFDRLCPGVLSLQLSYLALRMCFCRVALLETMRSDEPDDTEVRHYYQARCRKAARSVIDFAVSLRQHDMSGCWMPYTAYHFTSAATLILRCALEAENDETARDCVASAKVLIDYLRQTKDDIDWDLADICLAQCEGVVKQMCDEDYLDFRRRNVHNSRPQINIPDNGNMVTHESNLSAITFRQYHQNVDGVQQVPASGPMNQEIQTGTTADGGNVSTPMVLPNLLESPSTGVGENTDFSHDLEYMAINSSFPDLWQLPHMDPYQYVSY